MPNRLSFMVAFVVLTGCGEDGATNNNASPTAAEVSQASPSTKQSGTITVGDERWTISPMKQCSVYPGGIVNIWGYAADNDSLEIVIDYGGPTGARIGNDGPNVKWQAERETLEVDIDGKSVRGTATFNRYVNGIKESAEGSFQINC